MKVNIGFIGNNILQDVLHKVASTFPDIEMTCYFYTDDQQAMEKVKIAEQHEDILVFGGPIPYFYVKNNYTCKKPMIYISYDGSAFYKGLMQVSFLKESALERISIDGINQDAILDIYQELKLDSSQLKCISSSQNSKSEILQTHEELYEAGQTTCAVTSIKSVYEALQQKDIPSVLILATESSIRVAFQRAVLESKSLYFKNSQIAVGHIRFQDAAELTGYKKQQLHLERHQKLLSFAKTLHADIFSLGEGEFVFYSTRGMIGRKTNEFMQRLFKELNQGYEHQMIHIGMGFGASAQVAGDRARKALAHATHQDGHQCYLIKDDQHIIDILNRSGKEYRTSDQLIQQLAANYQVSAMVIKRVLEAVEALGKNRITAEELAAEINQTIRNSRRTLNEFVTKGLAVQVGEEHFGGKGRPKMVYQLQLTKKEEDLHGTE